MFNNMRFERHNIMRENRSPYLLPTLLVHYLYCNPNVRVLG